jgi:serine protease Do
VTVVVVRDGKELSLKVDISELPVEEQELPGTYDNALGGVHVQDLVPDLRKTLDMPERLEGVLVTDVEIANGLRRGDVIMEVNREKITNVKDYHHVASKIGPESDILLLIYRGGSVIYITASGGER